MAFKIDKSGIYQTFVSPQDAAQFITSVCLGKCPPIPLSSCAVFDGGACGACCECWSTWLEQHGMACVVAEVELSIVIDDGRPDEFVCVNAGDSGGG